MFEKMRSKTVKRILGETSQETKDKVRLQTMHSLLRKARYFYYEGDGLSEVMTDYEYDMMEKEYDILAKKLKTEENRRITNFVGFDIGIPMNIFEQSFYCSLYHLSAENKRCEQ
jgi:hypothetical protein